ncbi:MAG: signal transduction protein, partial [Cyanobacteria bacterium J06607_10]
NVSYKPATVRAFYFMLPLDREVPLGVYRLDDFFNPLINKFATINGLDVDKAISTDDIDFSLDYALSNDLNSALHIHYIFDKSPNLKFTFDIDKVVSLAISPLLRQSLEEVKRQLLPVKSQKNRENFQQWWESNGVKWTEQLRAVMIQHRNIGQDWKLTPKQKALLQQYYEANQLLAACLNSDCYVSREVRQEIEDGLLVPTRL